jgi:Ca2+-binding EF-hand superfamily protein
VAERINDRNKGDPNRQISAERILQIFEVLDIDGDGVLNKDEFMEALSGPE